MDDIIIFDYLKKQAQLDRVAGARFNSADFLHRECCDRIMEQFDTIITKKFEDCLILGSKSGYLSDKIISGKVAKTVTEADYSKAMLDSSAKDYTKIHLLDEILPFKEESFDLIISPLFMHWINDLPGYLIQIRKILKKGGMFIAMLYGGQTLTSLRKALLAADSENNRACPRVSPFIDVRDGAALVQRAGFIEPVSASELIEVKYENVFEIMKDLKNMGENNALVRADKKYPGRDFFNKVNENYELQEGEYIAEFEIVQISGWKA